MSIVTMPAAQVFRPGGSRSCVPEMLTGSTGTPARRAMRKPPFLKFPGNAVSAARTLGKNQERVALFPDLLDGFRQRFLAARRAGAVDKNKIGQLHDPADQGNAARLDLGQHPRVQRQGAEQQGPVQVGQVVADDDRGQRQVDGIQAVDDRRAPPARSMAAPMTRRAEE